MIDSFKDIVTDNPFGQVWKQLRFFLDKNYTSKLHCEYMGLPFGRKEFKRYKKNVEKQATQIGYCIRQAEEYFLASQQVDLPTRPLLLYYGAYSLGTALTLIKNTGEFALDKISQGYKAHGLKLKVDQTSFESTEIFLQSIRCQPVEKGFFLLFCESLVQSVFHNIGLIEEIVPNTIGPKTNIRTVELFNSANLLSRHQILTKNFGNYSAVCQNLIMR